MKLIGGDWIEMLNFCFCLGGGARRRRAGLGGFEFV